MAEKPKVFTVPSKSLKSKRPSTVSAPTSSRSKITSIAKEKSANRKSTAIIGDANTTILKQEGLTPDFDAEYRQIAYGKFLRAMLEECIVDEKIERTETTMDVQMTQLAERFQKTMNQLDMTNRRLKDISFVVEQKRLLDLKNMDSTKFMETTDNSNAQELLLNLNTVEEAYLNKLETKNVDFGFNKESGHQQLLDAVNDAIEGLNDIKKHSKLDVDKFREYEKAQKNIQDVEKDRLDLESMKEDFEKKFPTFSERLIKEASEKIAKMIDDDDDEDD